jgi:hypothetical protein
MVAMRTGAKGLLLYFDVERQGFLPHMFFSIHSGWEGGWAGKALLRDSDVDPQDVMSPNLAPPFFRQKLSGCLVLPSLQCWSEHVVRHYQFRAHPQSCTRWAVDIQDTVAVFSSFHRSCQQVCWSLDASPWLCTTVDVRRCRLQHLVGP